MGTIAEDAKSLLQDKNCDNCKYWYCETDLSTSRRINWCSNRKNNPFAGPPSPWRDKIKLPKNNICNRWEEKD